MKKLFAFPFEKSLPIKRIGLLVGMPVALLVILISASGCLTRPALRTETFSFDIPAATNSSTTANNPVLGIKSVSVAAPFADRPFVYRTSEFNYERDPYAAFLDFPEKELSASIRTGLNDHTVFSSVEGTSGALPPDIIVEINVSELFGDFREPKNPRAVLRAQFSFYHATNGIANQLILQREYTRSIGIKQSTAVDLMTGWNQALNEILAAVSADCQESRLSP